MLEPPFRTSHGDREVLSIMSFQISVMISHESVGVLAWADNTFLTATIRGEIGQPESLIVLVVGMHESFRISRSAICGASGRPVSFDASTSLHALPSMQGCQAVGWHSILNVAPQ